MKKLKKFKELIEKEEYFKAHEILEEEWLKHKKNNNELQYPYRGLINAAVSLELKKRGRSKKTYKKVWENFKKYEKYYSDYEEFIHIARFLENINP